MIAALRANILDTMSFGDFQMLSLVQRAVVARRETNRKKIVQSFNLRRFQHQSQTRGRPMQRFPVATNILSSAQVDAQMKPNLAVSCTPACSSLHVLLGFSRRCAAACTCAVPVTFVAMRCGTGGCFGILIISLRSLYRMCFLGLYQRDCRYLVVTVWWSEW